MHLILLLHFQFHTFFFLKEKITYHWSSKGFRLHKAGICPLIPVTWLGVVFVPFPLWSCIIWHLRWLCVCVCVFCTVLCRCFMHIAGTSLLCIHLGFTSVAFFLVIENQAFVVAGKKGQGLSLPCRIDHRAFLNRAGFLSTTSDLILRNDGYTC